MHTHPQLGRVGTLKVCCTVADCGSPPGRERKRERGTPAPEPCRGLISFGISGELRDARGTRWDAVSEEAHPMHGTHFLHHEGKTARRLLLSFFVTSFRFSDCLSLSLCTSRKRVRCRMFCTWLSFELHELLGPLSGTSLHAHLHLASGTFFPVAVHCWVTWF